MVMKNKKIKIFDQVYLRKNGDDMVLEYVGICGNETTMWFREEDWIKIIKNIMEHYKIINISEKHITHEV